MSTITVDGVEYVPKADPGPPAPVQILVLQRGWVAVGRLAHTPDSDILELRDASVIRVWGTTKGLGELRTGPTKDTVLDKAGTIRAHILTTVLTMDVDEDAWAKHL